MPIVTLPVPDTKDSITRPVVSGIINEILLALGMNKEKINVFYPDESNTVYQHNSTVGPDDPNAVRMPANEEIWIEVDDDFQEDVLLTTMRWQEEEPFIFRDDALRIYMKPTHVPCEMTINIKYQALDRTQAERWRNKLRGRMSAYQDMHHHLLKYHYLIPQAQVYILNELHHLRENEYGYGESFGTWMKNNGSPRFTKITNLAGKGTQLAIAESQMRVFGFWDFTAAPEKGSKSSGNETWTISVAYKLRYDRPTEVTLTYPLMIHNQLINEKLRPTVDRLSNVQEGKDRLFDLKGFLFEHHTPQIQNNKLKVKWGVVTPRFDEWVTPTALPRTCRILQVLTMVNPDDLKELFQLNDYENLEYTMEDEVMEFLASEYKWVNKSYASVFNIALYNQFGQLHDHYLEMLPDTTLRTTVDMNPRNYYHVRLSLHERWGDLNDDALRRLFKHPRVVELLLKHLGYHDLWEKIKDKFKDREGVIDKVVGEMADRPPYEDPRMRTVQLFSIIAYRDDPNDERYQKELIVKDGATIDPNQYRY